MSELEIKAAVRARDGGRCVDCPMTNAESQDRYGKILDVHRITPGAPYSLEGCVTVCRKCHAGRHKRPRLYPGRSLTEAMRFTGDIVDMVRQICSLSKDARGRPLKTTDFLDSILRPAVTREHAKVMERFRKGLKD